MFYNIVDYGAAVENAPKANAAAIQRAIDAACGAGGGTVYVPAGTFTTGNLRLGSNVCLHLDHGATLFGSPDFEDYAGSGTPWHFAGLAGVAGAAEGAHMVGFIYAVNAQNISITGSGTIDGNGSNHRFPDARDPMRRRPMLLYFDKCQNIRIVDVELKNSSMFALLADRSRGIVIRGVHIDTWEIENGDGLDFNGSCDVCISDCILETGDDGISLKTTYPDYPNRRYAISNCVFRSVWAGIRIGPESAGDMSEIAISNCVFENCNDALKIQNCETGRMENIRISNVVMRNVHRPLFMTANPFRLSRALGNIRPQLGGLHDVFIDGMTAYMSPEGREYQRNCFVVSGWKQAPIEHFELRNAKVIFSGAPQVGALNRVDLPEFLDYSFMYGDIFSVNGDYPASGLFLRHVDVLNIANCSFVRSDDDKRPLIMAYDLKNARMCGVFGENRAEFLSAIDAELELADCRHNGVGYAEAAPFSAENEARYRAFALLSDAVSAQFDQMAAQVDAAQHMELLTELPAAAWQVDGGRMRIQLRAQDRKTMLLLTSYGDGELLVNGERAAACRVPKLYRNMMAWAADISALLHDGENLVEIIWDDPSDSGGADCQLPFGEFRPYPVGLIRPVQVYVE